MNINNVYSDTGTQYDLVTNQLTDTIYASMASKLEPFATEKLIVREIV